MSGRPRTILIIEDEPLLNEAFALICASVAGDLAAEEPAIVVQVLQAHTFPETLALLQANETIDFVSVDLALRDDERGLGEADRSLGREMSGVLVLRMLRARPAPPLAVIVSGEQYPAQARATLHLYGVLHFYEKARLDFEQYREALKAALYSLEAADLVARLEGRPPQPDLLATAQLCWARAAHAAEGAGFDAQRLPGDIPARLRALEVSP